MVKTKTQFACTNCGALSPKWLGQCNDCNAWNSFVEETLSTSPSVARFSNYAGEKSNLLKLADVVTSPHQSIQTGISELDRVLGGGLVEGSVVLIGGDPGIGKSTLLLQTVVHMANQHKALYVTGEESLQQVTLRARRLGLSENELYLLSETHVERILDIAKAENPKILVLDSIQTMFTEQIASAPGSVSQVRESAQQLVRFAKKTGTSVFLVGHVTKEGALAGPRVLEHMVDTVLYFEGDSDSRFRVIRAVKNRFGAVNELGVFAMTERGLKEINNPSAIFLSRYQKEVAGSTVMVTWEGSRPLLVEVQALVDDSPLGNPRRVTVGLEASRLSMLLAVLHRHGGIPTFNQDVFVNVVGGIRVTEPAADLAIITSIVSSLRNITIPSDWVIFGEIGLAGEIRPVHRGQERIYEAAKHGFKRAIVPFSNAPKSKSNEIEIFAASSLSEALAAIT